MLIIKKRQFFFINRNTADEEIFAHVLLFQHEVLEAIFLGQWQIQVSVFFLRDFAYYTAKVILRMSLIIIQSDIGPTLDQCL